jgi:hypothetical protein
MQSIWFTEVEEFDSDDQMGVFTCSPINRSRTLQRPFAPLREVIIPNYDTSSSDSTKDLFLENIKIDLSSTFSFSFEIIE